VGHLEVENNCFSADDEYLMLVVTCFFCSFATSLQLFYGPFGIAMGSFSMAFLMQLE
jgi:hypothetical protein